MTKNNGVSSKRATNKEFSLVYTITAENLEWLEKLISLVPTDTARPHGAQEKGELIGSETLVVVDELLERIQSAKKGTYTVDENIPLWREEDDDWMPEKSLTTCPSCKQASDPVEREVVCPSCKVPSLPSKWTIS